jgi:hypothetical protein
LFVGGQAQNIVAIPGFDLDSPPSQTAPVDWTLTPAADGADFFVGIGPGFGALSDPNSANFGATGDADDVLSQVLATTAGDSYSISFELAHAESDGSNDFSASFGGFTGFAIVNTPSFGYTLETFTATATGSATTLSFAGRENPSWYDLDNVDVEDLGPAGGGVPEPTWALMLSGFFGAGAFLRRRRAVTATA